MMNVCCLLKLGFVPSILNVDPSLSCSYAEPVEEWRSGPNHTTQTRRHPQVFLRLIDLATQLCSKEVIRLLSQLVVALVIYFTLIIVELW